MDHRNKLDELRTQIAEGRYEIDSKLVADAIIRHRSSLAIANAGLAHADRARRRRLTSIRRIGRRRSRRTPEPLAA